MLRKKPLSFSTQKDRHWRLFTTPSDLIQNFVESWRVRLLSDVCDLVEQRFEELYLAMLDGHCERNADDVASLVVIPSRGAVAEEDLWSWKKTGEMLVIDLIEGLRRSGEEFG